MSSAVLMMLRVLFWIGVIALSILFAIVLYVLFMAWHNPPRHHSTNIEMFKKGQMIFQEDVELGQSLIPNSFGRSSANGIIYETFHGTYGNRIGGPSEQSRADAEILMLGCSQAWGQGVSFNEMASTLAARSLGINSLNLSVPGTGTVYAAKRLENLQELKPKYVVYLFYESHLTRNIRRCAPVNNPLCIQMITAIRNSFGEFSLRRPTYYIEKLFGGAFFLMQRWYLDQYDGSGNLSYWKDAFWVLLDIYGKTYKTLFDNPYLTSSEYRSEVVAVFDFALERISRYSIERGAELIVVYVPYYNYPKQLLPLPADLRQVINRYGARIVDMSAQFNRTIGREEKDRGTYLFAIPNDGHLNKLGHSMIAKELIPLMDH